MELVTPHSHLLPSPHLGQGRQIRLGQKVHASVAFCDKEYRPKAKFSQGDTELLWDRLIASGNKSDLDWARPCDGLLEMDIFDMATAATAIDKISNSEKEEDLIGWVHRLTEMISMGRLVCNDYNYLF